MKKIGKILMLFIFSFILTILISNTSKASGGLMLEDLNYDVTLNADGSANVVETWKISIEDTNTLFKTFEVDSSKYKEITDVEVEEVTSSGNTNFTRINQYKYHVDKNCYYALMYNGKFEIAWGAHAEDVTKTYKISYKIVDAIKNYSDCSEFYWQFISTESEIPANRVEGTIKLPTTVQNKEDLKVWAHGPLNGNIEIISNDTVRFEVQDLKENTMLEARVVTPTSIFYLNQNKSYTANLNNILEEEQIWADEANAQRKQIEKREIITKLIITIIIIINIIVAINIIKKIKKYRQELKENPVIKPEIEYEYFRDIPDDTETPAGAGFLYYFKNSGLQFNIPKIVSATMLDLCMKQYIEFEVVDGKKEEIRINVNNKNDRELPEDERIVYEILKEVKVGNNVTKSFTMKDFEKYTKKNPNEVVDKLNKIDWVVEKLQEKKKNYSEELIYESDKCVAKSIGYILLAIFGCFSMMWLIVIPAIIAAVYNSKLASRYNRLTQKGVNEKAKWVGLKKYMEEFSMLDEKTVPELVLWEKYLVYATAFGISDIVLKQLKVVYPQITDMYDTTNYSYMNLMYSRNLNSSFLATLNNSITRSYQSATSYSSSYSSNYSSGSGSGGGFSSGGGGRRRRRTEWAVDKN